MAITSPTASVTTPDRARQENRDGSTAEQRPAAHKPAQHTPEAVASASDNALTEKMADNRPRLPAGKKHTPDNPGSKEKNPVQKNTSFDESIARLQDTIAGELTDVFEKKNKLHDMAFSRIMTKKQVNEMVKAIKQSPEKIQQYISDLADYYLAIVTNPSSADPAVSETGDKELKEKLTGKVKNSFKTRDDIINYLNKKTNIKTLEKNIKADSAEHSKFTKEFEKLLNILEAYPVSKNEAGQLITAKLDDLKSELRFLHCRAELQDSMVMYAAQLKVVLSHQERSGAKYERELAVLMGKLSDLRDKLMQHKLQNDMRLQKLQQQALQIKTEKEAAEIEKKIKEAEELQALFKCLGPLLIALCALLTALTGGATAKLLTLMVIALIVVDEILKSQGKTGIMEKVMEPVVKLMEQLQELIKDILTETAKASGKTDEELKELEQTLNIVAMVMTVVAMVAMMAALGTMAGKIVGHVASETVKQVLQEILKEVTRLLIMTGLVTAVVGAVNTITQAKIDAEILRRSAEIDFDQQLIEQLTAMMEQLMTVFSENQQEMKALNEKASTTLRESFLRRRSLLQNRPLSV